GHDADHRHHRDGDDQPEPIQAMEHGRPFLVSSDLGSWPRRAAMTSTLTPPLWLATGPPCQTSVPLGTVLFVAQDQAITGVAPWRPGHSAKVPGGGGGFRGRRCHGPLRHCHCLRNPAPCPDAVTPPCRLRLSTALCAKPQAARATRSRS